MQKPSREPRDIYAGCVTNVIIFMLCFVAVCFLDGCVFGMPVIITWRYIGVYTFAYLLVSYVYLEIMR